MKAKRRTEITVETHETTIIRLRHRQTIIFCESCQTNTLHLSIGQTVSFLSLSEFNHLAETEQIHSTQNADGLLLLCGNSLAAQPKE